MAQLRARLTGEVTLLRLLIADERVPRPSKWLLAAALAYLLSPIDLIPDFVPILGQADDVIVVGALCWLACRLLPRGVLADCRRRAGLT